MRIGRPETRLDDSPHRLPAFGENAGMWSGSPAMGTLAAEGVSASGASSLAMWWIIAGAAAGIGTAAIAISRIGGDLLLWIATRVGPSLAGLQRRNLGGWPCLVAESRSRSTGQPPLVLLHGLGVRKETMLNLLRGLCGQRRVIACDLPGFGDHPLSAELETILRRGREGHPPLRFAEVIARAPGPEIEAYLDAIEAWIGRVVDGPFDLCGASMGGALATALASRRPPGLRRLVLLGPAGVRAPIVNAFMRDVERDVNPLAIETAADFDRVLELNFTTPPRIPRIVKRALARDLRRRLRVQDLVTDGLGPLLLDGVRDRLSSVEVPVLVLWGGSDAILDSSGAPVFAAGLRNSTVEIVEGAGHTLHGDRPREVITRIESFLEKPDGTLAAIAGRPENTIDPSTRPV